MKKASLAVAAIAAFVSAPGVSVLAADAIISDDSDASPPIGVAAAAAAAPPIRDERAMAVSTTAWDEFEEEIQRILGRGGQGKRTRANIFAVKLGKRQRRACKKRCDYQEWLCENGPNGSKNCKRQCRADNTGGGRTWERRNCKFTCEEDESICLEGLRVQQPDSELVVSCQENCKIADLADLDPYDLPIESNP